MKKMGPFSFGAALIAAPKSLIRSLDVTFFELEHRTSCFTSWDTGRHVFRVGTPELDFGSKEIMRPFHPRPESPVGCSFLHSKTSVLEFDHYVMIIGRCHLGSFRQRRRGASSTWGL
jgi:hypothetical protein